MSLDAHARPTRAVAFTIATVLLAAALLGQLVRVHSLRGDHAISSIAFGVLTVLLVLSEIHPTTWTRVGERDGVTRGWAFAYALILLGNPILAITVMVAVRCYVNLSRGKSPVEIGFNSAQITASLSMGGLVLAYFGVHGNIARAGTMTIGECVGIVFGGLAIFGLNGIMTATVIGLEQDAGFLRAARAAFGLSATADGALLALAPIFAIAVESRIVALPLVGTTAALACRSAHASLRTRHLGRHDQLTLLPDRVMFDRQLAETLGDVEREMADGSVAVVVMDLDRFQQVNERFGHQVGDLVLIGFAERLASVLPPAGRPARLGGDEFAAIIRTTGTVSHLPDVVTQLHDLLVQQHTIDGLTVTTSVSVGVAIAPIHDGDAETLISTARTAMRRAKQFGTGVEFGTRWFGGVDDRRNHPQDPTDTTESTDTSVQRQLQSASDGLRW